MARSLPPTHRREESPLVRVGRRYRGGQRRARAPRGRAQGALSDRRDPEARRARLAKYRDLSRRADREYAESIQREFAADRRRALSRSMRSGGGRYDDTVDGALDWLFTPLVKTTRDIGEWLNEDLETTRGYGAEEWARRSLPRRRPERPRDGKRTAAGSGPTIGITGTTMDASSTSGTTSGERLRDDRRRLRPESSSTVATMTSTTARGSSAAGAGTSTPSDRRIPSIRVRGLATATGRALARAAAADGAPGPGAGGDATTQTRPSPRKSLIDSETNERGEIGRCVAFVTLKNHKVIHSPTRRHARSSSFAKAFASRMRHVESPPNRNTRSWNSTRLILCPTDT